MLTFWLFHLTWRIESPLLVSTKASKKRKFSVIVGAVTSLLCLILFVLGVLCWRHYLGDKNTRERGVG